MLPQALETTFLPSRLWQAVKGTRFTQIRKCTGWKKFNSIYIQVITPVSINKLAFNCLTCIMLNIATNVHACNFVLWRKRCNLTFIVSLLFKLKLHCRLNLTVIHHSKAHHIRWSLTWCNHCDDESVTLIPMELCCKINQRFQRLAQLHDQPLVAILDQRSSEFPSRHCWAHKCRILKAIAIVLSWTNPSGLRFQPTRMYEHELPWYWKAPTLEVHFSSFEPIHAPTLTCFAAQLGLKFRNHESGFVQQRLHSIHFPASGQNTGQVGRSCHSAQLSLWVRWHVPSCPWDAAQHPCNHAMELLGHHARLCEHHCKDYLVLPCWLGTLRHRHLNPAKCCAFE